jgi:cell division septation protein DedD
MPSREPELYKDKIEVSLDSRQIFYLFFGGAVLVGLVFVLGVMVGRRVEARGHFDRADTQAASDPLAALDRLERSDTVSFHGALTGAGAPTDVERAIGELDKHRAAARPEGKADKADKADKAEGGEPRAGKAEAAADKPEAKAGKADRSEARAAKADARPDKLEARQDGKVEARSEPVTRPDTDKARPDKRDGDKRDGDKRDGDKRDGDKRPRKRDDNASGEARAEAKADGPSARRSDAAGDKPVTKPDSRADSGKPADAKQRFTLQLSSFQDRSEAEAFLSATRSAGYQPYLTEAEVSGKGTFYRVRLGSYRSLEAANDAKTEYEKAAKKSAQIMRL